MTNPVRKRDDDRHGRPDPRRRLPRPGGTRVALFNSGREVWLYDDDNAGTIRDAGAMSFMSPDATAEPRESFDALSKRGVIIGYSLHQDDELDIAVYLGDPLTAEELSVARWLEPQTAFLRLPSGTLCIEPNDSFRAGPEEPTDTGGIVEVPPGDYRVTLYRIDHEALFRERLEWEGPWEVIVLTPGGTVADAVDDLLPYEPRRDMGWVRKYEIRGNRAEALAWFGDYWDTCILNLDAAAAQRLSLAPGSYLRIHVPAAGVTLVSAYAASWKDAQRLPLPTGVPLDEYGYAALSPMGEWNDAEALFCRREKATTRIENEYHDIWLAATVEVLDPAAHPPAAPHPKRAGLTPTDLTAKPYFDAGFLAMILSEVLPEVEDLDELPLPDALRLIDRKLGNAGLEPLGDLEWEEQSLHGATERACRLYAGKLDGFAAVIASEGSFDLLLIAEREDGRWIVTGLADDFQSRMLAARNRGVSNEAVEVRPVDEALKTIFAEHRKSVRSEKGALAAPPVTLDECAEAFTRLLGAAFG